MSTIAPAVPVDHRVPRPVDRARPRLALGTLLVVVLAFAAFSLSRMLPPQPYGLADDWRVFYAAGTVVHQGGNPYDPAVIGHAEQVADHYPSVQPALDDFANLPIVAWALQPFSLLPFWVSFALITALGLGAAVTALSLWLRRWRWKGWARWSVLVMLSWPALLGVYAGQFDLVLVALTIAGMSLAIRKHPVIAGAICMSGVLIKPHILWPLPLLLAAAQMPRRRAALQCLAAAAATALGALAAGELLMRGSTAAFVAHVSTFGRGIATAQPDLAGLPGMLQRLPAGSVLAALVVVLGAVATVAFAAFWGADRRALSLSPQLRAALGVGVGLAIWLVASPYSHPNDDILLVPVLALLVGRDALHAPDRSVTRACAGCTVLIAAYLVSPYAGGAVTIVAAALAWRHRQAALARASIASAALVGMVLLPMVWPFHLVAVSLAPLAVLLVAVGGAVLVRDTLSDSARSAGRWPTPSSYGSV